MRGRLPLRRKFIEIRILNIGRICREEAKKSSFGSQSVAGHKRKVIAQQRPGPEGGSAEDVDDDNHSPRTMLQKLPPGSCASASPVAKLSATGLWILQ